MGCGSSKGAETGAATGSTDQQKKTEEQNQAPAESTQQTSDGKTDEKPSKEVSFSFTVEDASGTRVIGSQESISRQTHSPGSVSLASPKEANAKKFEYPLQKKPTYSPNAETNCSNLAENGSVCTEDKLKDITSRETKETELDELQNNLTPTVDAAHTSPSKDSFPPRPEARPGVEDGHTQTEYEPDFDTARTGDSTDLDTAREVRALGGGPVSKVQVIILPRARTESESEMFSDEGTHNADAIYNEEPARGEEDAPPASDPVPE